MGCAACVARVENTLKKQPGVKDVSVSLASNMAQVEYDTAVVSAAELKQSVVDGGYDLIVPEEDDEAVPEEADAESVSGSDLDGYTITNSHEPLPEGRSGEEEISQRSRGTIEEGKIVATVLTTKVSRSMPARTSTTIKKTHSAKTADSSDTLLWGGMLLMAVIALFIWMRFEQSKE